MKFAALILAISAGTAAATFDVRTYGAKGDGSTLDTAAFQKAIDAAAPAKGTVVVPPGDYRSGAIFLKSGIEFRIEKGATLLGSQNIDDYPMMPTRVAGIEMTWPAALLNVYDQSHVRITGQARSMATVRSGGTSTGRCAARSTSRKGSAGPSITIAGVHA